MINAVSLEEHIRILREVALESISRFGERQRRDAFYRKLAFQSSYNAMFPDDKLIFTSTRWIGVTLNGADRWRVNEMVRSEGFEQDIAQLGMETRNRSIVYSDSKRTVYMNYKLMAFMRKHDTYIY
jgi:hypothetical protein